MQDYGTAQNSASTQNCLSLLITEVASYLNIPRVRKVIVPFCSYLEYLNVLGILRV